MRLINANALISDLWQDVERDMAVLDTLTLGRVSRESIQFDKDWKQNTIDLLMRAPTIEPEPQWIPCTERLPEDEYVIISKKPSPITGKKFSVTIGLRHTDPRSHKAEWRDIGFGKLRDDEVFAWQPLPEPYKEEGEQSE